MRSLIAFVVLALSACGNVASDGGAGGAGGAGGRLEATGGTAGGSASASGTGGQASAGAGGGNAATGGRGDGAGGNTATGGRGDAGGGRGGAAAICIGGTSDVQGFAYNHGCDGGTTSPTSCHANCELNGSQFIGCVNDARIDGGIVTCHASCSDCR